MGEATRVFQRVVSWADTCYIPEIRQVRRLTGWVYGQRNCRCGRCRNTAVTKADLGGSCGSYSQKVLPVGTKTDTRTISGVVIRV